MEIIKKHGGTNMFFTPPLYYNELIKNVKKIKLITIGQIKVSYEARRCGFLHTKRRLVS